MAMNEALIINNANPALHTSISFAKSMNGMSHQKAAANPFSFVISFFITMIAHALSVTLISS
ncbi:hypothetical protein CUU60_03310 [Paenibacillus polymyxa ATCC 842]|nr:hypothetical protein [Paenibacillus polymyxa]UOD84273.1 hypothetical protein CUU60_03310 [Paenibacillus polymyxa ATCC 842]